MKSLKYLIFSVSIFMMGIMTSNALNIMNKVTMQEDKVCSICYEASNQIRFIGYIILIVKILIPIVLIVMASMDLVKTVTSGNNDALAKSTRVIVKRAIAAVIIFFIPSLINFVLSAIDTTIGDDGTLTEYQVCAKCLFDPSGSECTSIVESAENETCEAKFSTSDAKSE